jgi:hypothetical protein
MASLAHETAVAAPARRPARRARPKARSRPKARARTRPGLLGGIVWIVVLAALLGGVVALNVAVLQLNVRLQEANARKADVRAQNVALAGRLSSAGSAPQVASAAEQKLGLVPAAPDQTTYVDLAARHRK